MSRQLALSSALSVIALATLALFGTTPAQSSPFAKAAITAQ